MSLFSWWNKIRTGGWGGWGGSFTVGTFWTISSSFTVLLEFTKLSQTEEEATLEKALFEDWFFLGHPFDPRGQAEVYVRVNYPVIQVPNHWPPEVPTGALQLEHKVLEHGGSLETIWN